MRAIWVGALLLVSGLVTLAAPPIRRRHLRRRRSARSSVARDTLKSGELWIDIDPDTDWPGIALVVMGAILLLAGAFA